MIIKEQVKNLIEFKAFIQKYVLPSLVRKSVLLLNGPVGAGKTESVKIITALLQMSDVASPSFAIHHQYINKNGLKLDHVDLYRLKDEEDLESTGFWDLFSQDDSIIIIEWGELVNKDLLPINWKIIEMNIEVINQMERLITLLLPVKNK